MWAPHYPPVEDGLTVSSDQQQQGWARALQTALLPFHGCNLNGCTRSVENLLVLSLLYLFLLLVLC